MKKAVLTMSAVALTLAMGNAQAACPNYLNAEETYDCIVMEGAGDVYVPSARTAQNDSSESTAKIKGQSTNQQALAESIDHAGI